MHLKFVFVFCFTIQDCYISIQGCYITIQNCYISIVYMVDNLQALFTAISSGF